MATPNSRQHAKELVAKIAHDHGYPDPEKMNKLTPDLRLYFEDLFFKKDLLIGSSVIALAKSIYTTKSRFIFELLQNADDNVYTAATGSGFKPYISYKVYPRQIVVECNENGFTYENLEAICAVGQSSKTKAQGYIGEKGIGFKSVFAVASKVHIQSNAFSFSFTHNPEDSGIGMISPVWEDSVDELTSPMTRMTLHLHDHVDGRILSETHQSIHEQFGSLQPTVLLFLKNLKRVCVSFYDEKGEQTKGCTYSKEPSHGNRVVLKKVDLEGGRTVEKVSYYHLTRHNVTNLAPNENRRYSKQEESTRAYSESEVILAFPIEQDSEPLIATQDLFVFLPVRKVGFKFLIQADFVTNASRQDIVTDSPRNRGLVDGIADAFVMGVLQFCQHDSLRYKWMRYLPDRSSKDFDGLWLSLIEKITDRLACKSVLYARSRPGLFPIAKLFRLTSDVVDENGEPLFDEDSPPQIISQHYATVDLNNLTVYGLEYVNWGHVGKWLEMDLRRDVQSRMKSSTTTESWHTCVAKLLQVPFAKQWDHTIHTLKALDLLPLEDGTWVSASSGPVYFAHVDDLAIPSGIGLRLIPKEITNTHRTTLFKSLGVQTASLALVRGKIFGQYLKDTAPPNIHLPTSKRDLEFLYLTHHLVKDKKASYEKVWIFTNKGWVRPHGDFVYIANDEPYGAWEVFRETPPGSRPGDGAPGFYARFVDEEYFRAPPETPTGQKLSWIAWFHDFLDVERRAWVGLRNQDLSEPAEYLQKYRPEKFLRCLRDTILWSRTLSQVEKDILRGTEVLCVQARQLPWKDTYVMTTELQKRTQRFVEPDAFFPWLWLDADSVPDGIPSQWAGPLAELSLGSPASDLHFAIDMLKYSCASFPSIISESSRRRLFNLYYHVQEKFRESEDRAGAKEMIRNAFSESKRIFIPISGGRCTWAYPAECVWSAPQAMLSKYSLQQIYQPFLSADGEESSQFERLFKTILGIQDCSSRNLIDELKALKTNRCEDSDVITAMYMALDKLRPNIIGISADEIRAAFKDEALIYVPLEGKAAWHPSSQCVWSNVARLRGKPCLNDDYEDLKELFVNFLGVKPVDLVMVVDELKELGNRPSTSPEQIKELIWTVNSLLPAEAKRPSHTGVVSSKVFPIRNPDGEVTLKSSATNFFVVDREFLKHCFKDKTKLLDFSLEDVVRLRPFIAWARLEDRFLSRRVKEITSFHGSEITQTLESRSQICGRAHAFLRIAAHFDSPRVQSEQDLEDFYGILRNAEIYETDGISSHLILDGIDHPIEGRKDNMHIDEAPSSLKVYLPRNKEDQQYIYNNFMSQRLFSWMMRYPTTQISGTISEDGVKATRDILLAPLSRLATALADNGIATIKVENIDPVADFGQGSRDSSGDSPEDNSEASTLIDGGEHLPSFSGNGVYPRSRSPTGSYHTAASSRYDRFAAARPSPVPDDLDGSLPHNLQRTADLPLEIVHGDRHYVALLDQLIVSARSRHLREVLDRAQEQNNDGQEPTRRIFDIRGATQWERDCKVGAAGELYVFELLSKLSSPRSLPNFSHDNWQSKMRKFVTVHADYEAMPPWPGRYETSDIVYNDNESVLTEFLIEGGYLDRSTWTGAKPEFFIEVKATTLKCNAAFYMSKAQEKRMRSHVFRPGKNDVIYVVFRVFNLGHTDVGLKIYVDPETLRLEEKLKFIPETWMVVPTE